MSYNNKEGKNNHVEGKQKFILQEAIRQRISRLEIGVKNASPSEHADDGDLEGSDHGLYPKLVETAQRLDYQVVDNDELTKDILIGGRKGLRKKFYTGWLLMIKQGSPLQMTATLAHELGHHFTPDIEDEGGKAHSESIAEGTAFVIADYYGLDISTQAFPYIAGYNDGTFTAEMKEGIEKASTWILSRVSGAAKG